MSTILKNILNFTGLAIGVPSVQPHLLNINGVAYVPRILDVDGAGFTVTADTTNVTITRGASAPAAVNVYCELWHSIEDAEPLPGGIATSNYPFVVQGAGSAGGGGITAISGGTTLGTGQAIVFSNGGGITFGMAGNTMTASVQTAGGTATGVGLSAGTQSQATGNVVFSNSNNVSFGMSNSSVVTASASFPAETPFGVSAGTQSVSTGTLVFSNSNGLTFGMSGSSRITGSYSQSTAPNAIAVNAAGSVTAGTAVFSNSNNVTFGLNGSTITASASIAATVFSNSNNVTFGLNGSTITASASFAAGGAANASFLEINDPVATAALDMVSLSVDRFFFAGQMNVTRNDVMLSLGDIAIGASPGTVTVGLGIYTMNGSTASLASSRSGTFTYNTNNESQFSNLRWRSFTGGTWSMTPGDYLVGFYYRVSTTMPMKAAGVLRIYPDSVEANGTYTNFFAQGVISSAGAWTLAPNSIALSNISQTNISGTGRLVPTIRFAGSI